MMARSDRAPRGGSSDLTWEPIVFGITVLLLVGFGLLMIYSASSITALTSETTNHNPTYYLTHQLVYAVVGIFLAAFIASQDYHLWCESLRFLIVGVVIVLLGMVLLSSAGQDAYGATRWLSLGPVSIQPSEFSKASAVLASAYAIARYFEGYDTMRDLGINLSLMVGLPLALVLLEPDKGTFAIISVTVVVMLFLAGMPMKAVGTFIGVIAAIVLLLAFKDDYARSRIMTVLNPWEDPYGDGYQIIQGLYAFGSGGLFGVGLGSSRQKYSYLPMAHNDFIYAVIGEELGLVGTLGVLLLFLLLIWLGFKIAQNAPDLSGRLIAAGCVTMLAIQLLVNACGVLALIPLSGKPIPFLSYGGSSILSTLILAGLVLSVAHTSKVSARSQGFTVYEGSSQGLRVIEGGLGSPADVRASRDGAAQPMGRVSYNANGTRRINLGPSASDRLRSRDASRGGRG